MVSREAQAQINLTSLSLAAKGRFVCDLAAEVAKAYPTGWPRDGHKCRNDGPTLKDLSG
jgi:hypothetical protein